MVEVGFSSPKTKPRSGPAFKLISNPPRSLDPISDPEKMTPQQIQKLQNLLGVTQTVAGIQPIKRVPHRRNKIGPNQKCPCDSGKKYKKCCGANKKSSNQVRK